MDQALIEQVRRFNRTVTERVGALDDHFMGRALPLGAARLLWEIGPDGAGGGKEGIEVRALRQRLGLDSAYVSRLLRTLERKGLVSVVASRDDGRVRRARLTAAGRAERRELDRRSDGFARALLTPLSPRQQERLTSAMAEVERLLNAAAVDIAAAHPDDYDARRTLEAYFAEIGARFDHGFDPGRSLLAQAHEVVPPAGLLLVARLRQEPVGCGAVKLRPGALAELKRMWVSPSVRGLGVGHRLLGALEDHARAAGATRVRLETNRALAEAIALYRRSGYREVPAFNAEPYAHHWFEKDL